MTLKLQLDDSVLMQAELAAEGLGKTVPQLVLEYLEGLGRQDQARRDLDEFDPSLEPAAGRLGRLALRPGRAP